MYKTHLPRSLLPYSSSPHRNYFSSEKFSSSSSPPPRPPAAAATAAFSNGFLALIASSSLLASYFLYSSFSSSSSVLHSASSPVSEFSSSLTAIGTNERKNLLSNKEEIENKTLQELQSLFTFPSSSSSLPVSNPSLSFLSSSSRPFHSSIEREFRLVQDHITQQLCNLEYSQSLQMNAEQVPLREDITLRHDGSGGGIARVIQGGSVFSKAGCNTSFATTQCTVESLRGMAADHEQIRSILSSSVYSPSSPCTRYTASISLVLHGRNPFVPSVHANYRYFEYLLPDKRKIFWFGGGSDLTPVYVSESESAYFHLNAKSWCDETEKSYYPRFKQWCDQYFYLPARGETRGVGGIFFDDLYEEKDFEKNYSFVKRCAERFSETHFPLVMKNLNKPFNEQNTLWQQIRGGRYVEFNLLYDKGTTYGFKLPPSQCRPEAILMSLPEKVQFHYKFTPKTGSQEEFTIKQLKQTRDWVQLSEEQK